MHLSKDILAHITPDKDISIPTAELLELPEKVLQFGTGVLLRGLPDHYIDQANKKGLFNGRVVVVKSTPGMPPEEFNRQDNLFTLCIRGIKEGRTIDEYSINAAISRVISAQENWAAVLQCAANEQIRIVISNTTEIGITLNEKEKIGAGQVPESFPGKLTACLYHRYNTLGGAAAPGMVILPTELLPENGSQLKAICIRLAELNNLEPAFIQWLQEANDFCNTLVDCIVPGSLRPHDARQAEQRLGYTDSLLIMSEAYRLWAIETDRPEIKSLLSFAEADSSIIITGDIGKFRDLKLRLLNGAHTFSCGLALLNGFETVKEAMHHPAFEKFIQDLMLQEIAPTVSAVADLQPEEAALFSRMVLDRFRNPHIEHRWASISQQYTAKMRMRNIPTLLAYYEQKGKVPQGMALGFAAYLYFMRSERLGSGDFLRHCYGKGIRIDDSHAGTLHEKWNKRNLEETVHESLSDAALWGADLSLLPGFEEAVVKQIYQLRTKTKPAGQSVSA